MLAVADTSPSNYLVLLEEAALLLALYTCVVLPPAVLLELRDPEAPAAVRAWATNLPAWCEVRRPFSLVGAEFLAHLGAGESVIIAPASPILAARCSSATASATSSPFSMAMPLSRAGYGRQQSAGQSL